MKTYKLYKTPFGKDAAITVNEDGSSTSFLFDPDNADYAEYLRWLALGNTPEPADEVTT
ncbi:hypothetical protein UFOVP267_58 [uncultured Caudovirales phage]|uniref:Uncharacterized protein n=1 Tax=uncultured Caudovirales phage TaxID=2100421 RepID=A0A6J5LN52_9CAUD|nr:hypothetical protein UFOVP267_58 [uncultured Caudovirales phage]